MLLDPQVSCSFGLSSVIFPYKEVHTNGRSGKSSLQGRIRNTLNEKDNGTSHSVDTNQYMSLAAADLSPRNLPLF